MISLTALLAGSIGLSDPVADFNRFDFDGDGRDEITSLEVMADEGEGPLVLALVERRLAPFLGAAIEQWTGDLAHEGHHALAISVGLGAQERHQDGLTLLALRELLRAFDSEQDLRGAVLVGRFPDAYVVRTCNWHKKGKVEVDGETYSDTPFLRRVPEGVAHRAEIVLSDLDGHWEDIYVQPRTLLESVVAVCPEGTGEDGAPYVAVRHGTVAFEDFFHVSDGVLELDEDTITLRDAEGDPECCDEDRERPNVIARPDIVVSRIDARGVALRPREDVVGVDGKGLLDERGQPRAVSFAKDPPHWREALWEFSPQLEQRLLTDYFVRNHAYRRGTAELAWRPASIACDLSSGYGVLLLAADDWEDTDRVRDDIRGRPNLNHLANWLARPAVLRTLRAHSNPLGSAFARTDASKLDERLGKPWAWTPQGSSLVPSLEAASSGGALDWFLLHALWRGGAIAAEPAFYHHTGCHGISPPGAWNTPYDDPSYGLRQGAEALLMFGSGLALVGRAKVFYDEPTGFAEALGSGETFGHAWAHYFEVESRAASWAKAGGDIGRKRSYFWSVLGDWTLRLER